MHARIFVAASLAMVAVASLMEPSGVVLAQACNASPDRPLTASAVRDSDGSVSVSWTVSTTGCAATRFYLEASRGTSEVIEETIDDGEERTAELGLGTNNGTPWRISVRAFNEFGLSAGRSAVLSEGATGPPRPNECAGAPFPPTLTAANAVGRILVLTWQPPSQCAVGVTGYTVIGQYAPNGAVIGTISIPYPARSWSGEVPPGAYYVSVITNSYGLASTPSNTIFVQVP
jgi:hypothetical protein